MLIPRLSLRALGTAAMVVVLTVHPALAQDPTTQGLPPGMTPEQAMQLLRNRPDAARLLRERLRESGLAPEEIRARLRAAGYPTSLLDAYLTSDTLPGIQPGAQAVDAVSRLGLARFSRQDSLILQGDTVALRLYQDSERARRVAYEDSVARARRGLELFGLNVFRQATTQFQPILPGPVSDSYLLGPGDELVVFLTGGVEAAHAVEVTQGGFVVIPQVGEVNVNGLTLGQAREVLFERLRRAYSSLGRGPEARTRLEVTVATVRAQSIRVIGEVAQPGTYRIAATGSVLSALYEAGGLLENSGFRAIQVRRGTRLVGTVDLYDYLLRGETPADVPLAAGDVIFVPVRGARVKVSGEVTRPAIYEVLPGETVGDLIAFAGGLTPLAATHAVTIHRVVPPSERTTSDRARTVLSQPLGPIVAGAERGPELVAGDSVVVYSVHGGPRNAVTLEGSVWQPGTFQVDPGMRLSDLLRMGGGVRPEAFLDRVTVLRTFADSTRQMFAVGLGPDGMPQAGDDPELRERDVVTVFSRIESRPARYVEVRGAVGSPGRLVHADSMTLRDAILLAGGPSEDAYMLEAEVSRMAGGGTTGDTLAVTMRVPLDSGLVLDPALPIPPATGRTPAADVTLRPYDNVFVRRRPGWERPRNVVLTGEVRFPGHYTILSKDDRLSSVLERAGGLTDAAYSNGIQFFRRGEPSEGLGLPPGRLPLDTTRLTTLAMADTTQRAVRRLPAELTVPTNYEWGWVGRIGVDLPAVLRDPSHVDNVVLMAGDSINIPARIPFVRVEGAVNSPATVTHRPGEGVRFYVDGAGGFTRNAHRGGTFVLQPNGKIVKGGDPEPGAVVVVPARDPREPRRDFLQILASLAPAVVSLATIVVVLATQP